MLRTYERHHMNANKRAWNTLHLERQQLCHADTLINSDLSTVGTVVQAAHIPHGHMFPNGTRSPPLSIFCAIGSRSTLTRLITHSSVMQVIRVRKTRASTPALPATDAISVGQVGADRCEYCMSEVGLGAHCRNITR